MVQVEASEEQEDMSEDTVFEKSQAFNRKNRELKTVITALLTAGMAFAALKS